MKNTCPETNLLRRNFSRWARLAAIGLIAFATVSSHAADTKPPDRMTYQGFLVDANGDPLAPTTPANFPMVFRIFSGSTGGTALWTEQQVVTVDKGNFSVLLGEGSTFNTDSRPDLSALFGGTTSPDSASDRYVEVTVTISGTAKTIAPRLRLLPAPYAFLATKAISLDSSSSLKLDGSNTLEFGAGTAGKEANSGKIGYGAFTGDTLDIVGAGSASTSRKIKLWSGGGLTIEGSVGIGTASPGSSLEVTGGIRARGGTPGASGANNNGYAFSGNSGDTDSGMFSTADGLVQFYTDSTEKMRINSSSNVGIGTTAPGAALDVAQSASAAGRRDLLQLTHSGHNALTISEFGGSHSTAPKTVQIGAWNAEQHISIVTDTQANLQAGGSTKGIRIKSGGNVGIGTADPQRPLHVKGDQVLARIEGSSVNGSWLTFGNSSANQSSTGYWWQLISTGVSNGEGAGQLLFRNAPYSSTDDFNGTGGQAVRMILTKDGNLGIGTTAPGVRLHISGGGIKLDGGNTMEFGAGVAGKESSAGKIGYGTFTTDTLDIVGAGSAGTSRKIKLWAEGGLTVNGLINATGSGGSVANFVFYAKKADNTANINFSDGTATDYSIIAEKRIAALEFNATSNARIKQVVGPSNSRQDLATIQKLRVTDYRPVDRVAEGTDLKKGFIAQEVQSVIPEAVGTSRRFVPDIYALPSAFEFDAARQTLTVTLSKAHGLAVGDRVQLFADESRLELTVATVSTPETFVAEKCDHEPKQVFVYGKEVPDFLTLNYDRIFTTGISALQELARQVDSLKAREARLTELEEKASKVDTLERDVAELRRLVAQLAAVSGNDRDSRKSVAKSSETARSSISVRILPSKASRIEPLNDSLTPSLSPSEGERVSAGRERGPFVGSQ